MANETEEEIQDGEQLLLLFRLSRFRGRRFRFYVLDFARVNFFLSDLAYLPGVGVDQRRSATGELAGAAGRYQNVAIIAVKAIFEFHSFITSRVFISLGAASRKKQGYCEFFLPSSASGIFWLFLSTVSPGGKVVSRSVQCALPERWPGGRPPTAPAGH